MNPNITIASQRTPFGDGLGFIVYCDPVDEVNALLRVEDSVSKDDTIEENDENKKIEMITNNESQRFEKEAEYFEASLLLNFAKQAQVEAQVLDKELVNRELSLQGRQDQPRVQVELEPTKIQRKLLSLKRECNANQRKLNYAYRQHQAERENKLALLNQEVEYQRWVSNDFGYQKRLWEYYEYKLKVILDEQDHIERLYEVWQNELSSWWCHNVVSINTKGYRFNDLMKVDDSTFESIDYPMLLG